MTNERHELYREAVKIIDSIGPAKLQPEEEEILRDAAEGLLLCMDPEGQEATDLLAGAKNQLVLLVDSGRWSDSLASNLLEKIEGCAHGSLIKK